MLSEVRVNVKLDRCSCSNFHTCVVCQQKQKYSEKTDVLNGNMQISSSASVTIEAPSLLLMAILTSHSAALESV